MLQYLAKYPCPVHHRIPMPPCGARWPVERMPEKHLEERFLDGRPGGQATLKQEAGVLNLTDWKLVPAMGHSASGKEEPVVADQCVVGEQSAVLAERLSGLGCT